MLKAFAALNFNKGKLINTQATVRSTARNVASFIVISEGEASLTCSTRFVFPAILFAFMHENLVLESADLYRIYSIK